MNKPTRLIVYPFLCMSLAGAVACGDRGSESQSADTPAPSVIRVVNDPPVAGDAGAADVVGAEGQADGFVQIAGAPANVQATFNTYCIECHGESEQKGDVRFDTLGTMDPTDRADLFSDMHEVLEFEEMPPDNKPQPTDDEREALLEWLGTQVDLAASDLADKLRYPHYGNLVDHEALFSGEIDEPAYTPARRWLVSPQIFHERVIEVFRLDGHDRDAFVGRDFYGVTNPFVLPDDSGVRDYDIGSLTGGHLLVMLNNAQWIAGKQIFAAQLEMAEDRQAVIDGLSRQDRWYPRTTPEAFAVIVKSETPATEEQMVAAIQEQFDAVLRREATDEEVQRYLGLLRESIQLGGNVEGLKRMLTAVLLESEFLYRIERGGGEPDEDGRRMLTPREGAYAISYALGDRGPDDQLWQAAAEGRLQTREDYRREVLRLLEDDQYYRGQVDPGINGNRLRSVETSHPRQVRFWREFFGYPNATKVFKDPPRIGGLYENLRRGSTGTAGRLINEADQFVTLHVEADQDVINRLLTSNEFYVYHNLDNEAGALWVEQCRAVWDRLQNTDWKENPEQVLAANIEFILETAPPMQMTNSSPIRQATDWQNFLKWMMFFEETFGQGRRPFTLHPNSHGYDFKHAPLYSLPPTPQPQRYGVRQTVSEPDDMPVFWDYEPVQPFAIDHRMGILTHPAWLVAHSTNFHSDPIRRGRWVREKLLAGRVPDVPITVDAVVPEDPEHTFRERVERVTTAEDCWGCHQQMNPLGLPFEAFDDFGRYRTVEDLEHPDNLIREGDTHGQLPVYPTAPVVTTGAITGTGIPELDGEVDDPFELIDRIAQSDLARQSIIRHAFRFYMGRNERLSDSQTLIDADRAYIESGGSFKAVIVSLLTSDSFLYRMEMEEE